MLNPELLDKQIFMMTGSEILELFGALAERKTITRDFTQKQYEYGIDGIAKIFKCSRTTAQSIKNSGKIDEAIYQTGKKIVIDPEKALELMQKP